MKLYVPLTVLPILLLACASPQERCMAAAYEEISTVDRLIRETRTNLERGYRIERRFEQRMELQFCARPSQNFMWCNRAVTRPVETEIAIDPAAEQRTLDALLSRRQALEPQYIRDVSACRSGQAG